MAKIAQIDDRSFTFDISLGSGVSLTKSSIRYLEIDSRLPSTGFVEGFMVVDNTAGALDNLIKFGGDPFTDLMYIYIQANDGDEGEISTPPVEHALSIYKVDNLPIGEYPRSMKRIYFREIGGQALREIKSTVSIEDFKEITDSENDITNMSNNERGVRTDVYLRKVFEKAGIPVSKDNWAKGKHYTPPLSPFGNEYCYDVIKKIHSRHISEEAPHDFIYTYWDNKDNEMKSYPMHQVFEKFSQDAEWVLESFILGDMGVRGDGGSGGIKVAKNASSDLSVIKSFNHEYPNGGELGRKMSLYIPVTEGATGSRFNNGAKFLDKTLSDYKKYFVDPLGDNSAIEFNDQFKNNILESSNTFKSTFLRPDYAEQVDTNAVFFNNLINNSHKINITTRGMPYRRSGLFADIASIEGGDATERHRNICGRYWITSCKHIFSDEKYWNEISGVKTYASK